MSRSSRRLRKSTRNYKFESDNTIIDSYTRETETLRFKEKFSEERTVKKLEPKTEAQFYYLESLNNNTITVATGHAGVGKSYVSAYSAASLLLLGKIEKIIVTRPYAHLGKDYGATPGTDWEKLEPFCRPMLDTIKKVVGEGRYNYFVEKGMIEISPLEKIQGRSFDEKCCILADECQNATKPQLISLVTRLGDGVKFLALMGDPRQSINRGENALDWIVRFFERNKISDIGICYFTEEDCVRSGIVREILVALEREGGFYTSL